MLSRLAGLKLWSVVWVGFCGGLAGGCSAGGGAHLPSDDHEGVATAPRVVDDVHVNGPAGGFQGAQVGEDEELLGASCGAGEDSELEYEEMQRRFRAWIYEDRPEGLVKIVSGRAHFCGLGGQGSVFCWGWNADGRTKPPKGVVFKDIAAGVDHTCGVTGEARVRCGGGGDEGQLGPVPSRKFVSVFAARAWSCGLDAAGKASCWGKGAVTVPADLRFKSLALGEDFGCGLVKGSGQLRCWGKFEVDPSQGKGGWKALKMHWAHAHQAWHAPVGLDTADEYFKDGLHNGLCAWDPTSMATPPSPTAACLWARTIYR